MNHENNNVETNTIGETNYDCLESQLTYGGIETPQRRPSTFNSVKRLDTEYSYDLYGSQRLSHDLTNSHPRLWDIFDAHLPTSETAINSEERQEENDTEDDKDHLHGKELRVGTLRRTWDLIFRSLGALGIIYGDIGTSPIYTISSIYAEDFDNNILPDTDDVIGGVSNVIWLLIMVVCIKYCFFVLCADFNGEGGTFAMYEKIMASGKKISNFSKKFLPVLACVAASLLLGDATITPAISVMSALEGIQQIYPSFTESYVDGVSVFIIILLFAMQYKGTRTVGIIFGPIIILWLVALASLGIYFLHEYDGKILRSLSPASAIKWWIYGNYSGWKAFKNFSSVLLSITGAEAMFADMGHFGRDAVNASWFSMVLPALLLQYLGQGAYLLHVINPDFVPKQNSSEFTEFVAEISTSVFWSATPKHSKAFYGFMLVLATLSTIVASQAVISGAFTLMSQASALGFVPKLNVVYTNAKHKGQVYIGVIAFLECIVCCAMILGFQKSVNLSAAYGAAVTSVFLITTIFLTFYIAPICWGYPRIIIIIMITVFGSLDLIMWSSSMQKVPNGAWVPLVVGFVIITIMGIWTTGHTWVSLALDNIVNKANSQLLSLQQGLAFTMNRSEGIGIFLTPSRETIPLSLSRLCSRLHVLPQYIVLTTLEVNICPFVPDADRIDIYTLEEKEYGSVYSMVINYGWAEPLSSLNILQFIQESATNPSSRLKFPEPLLERFSAITYDSERSLAYFENFEKQPLSIFLTTNIVKPASDRTIIGTSIIWLYNSLKATLSPTIVQYFSLPPDNTTQIGVSIPT